MSDLLAAFIADAKGAGVSHTEIETTLLRSGWEKKQVSDALGRFVDTDFPVAVPRPVPYASPRLVFLNIFHFLVLYVSVYNVVSIIFTFLDCTIPDGLGRMAGVYYSHRPIADQIRDNLSIIIVTLPLVFITNGWLKKAMAQTRQRIPRIRLKLIYGTFFISACTLLGSSIAFVHYLLDGELGIRFIIKVGLLLILTVGLRAAYRNEVSENEAEA